MGIEKKVLSIRMDDAIIEALKRLAEKENRSLSNYIETILKNHIKSETQNSDKL